MNPQDKSRLGAGCEPERERNGSRGIVREPCLQSVKQVEGRGQSLVRNTVERSPCRILAAKQRQVVSLRQQVLWIGVEFRIVLAEKAQESRLVGVRLAAFGKRSKQGLGLINDPASVALTEEQ